MPVLFDWLRLTARRPIAPASPTPALRKVREGRGTHPIGDGGEIKSLGHPAHGGFARDDRLRRFSKSLPRPPHRQQCHFGWAVQGGWPGVPVPGQWVPRPCVLCKGGCDAACTMGLVMPSGLHRTYGAHHCTLSLPRATGDCLFSRPRAAAIVSLRSWNRLASAIGS